MKMYNDYNSFYKRYRSMEFTNENSNWKETDIILGVRFLLQCLNINYK